MTTKPTRTSFYTLETCEGNLAYSMKSYKHKHTDINYVIQDETSQSQSFLSCSMYFIVFSKMKHENVILLKIISTLIIQT